MIQTGRIVPIQLGSVSETAANLSSKAATIFPNPVPNDDFTIKPGLSATVIFTKVSRD